MRQHMFYRIWVNFQNKGENIEKWIKKNKGKSQDNAEKFNEGFLILIQVFGLKPDPDPTKITGSGSEQKNRIRIRNPAQNWTKVEA